MPEISTPAEDSSRPWFLAGVRAALSLPGLVLVSAMVGFASLARESGFGLAEALYMTAAIWALPAQVVLIGSVTAGATLVSACLAVALSSLRLTPMVMALVPELRGPRTRPWVLYVLAHFIAVTSWVIALERAPKLPREFRTAFYAGLTFALLVGNLLIVTLFYELARGLPPPVSACLLMLTPMYFLCSMWGSARERAGRLALVLGLASGPVFHVVAPGFDLPLAGVVSGGLTFAWHLSARRRRGA